MKKLIGFYPPDPPNPRSRKKMLAPKKEKGEEGSAPANLFLNADRADEADQGGL